MATYLKKKKCHCRIVHVVYDYLEKEMQNLYTSAASFLITKGKGDSIKCSAP